MINTTLNSGSTPYHFYYHTEVGDWNLTTANIYNNTQYDSTLTGLQTLSNGKYAVNWVYRSLAGTSTEMYVVLGNGNYTLAQAQASTPPTVTANLSKMSILVGRIIVQKGATTATQIDSAFTKTFATSGVFNHNDLSNIQGGSAGNEYHLGLTNESLTKTTPTTSDNLLLKDAADST